jgi:hypothetical protein
MAQRKGQAVTDTMSVEAPSSVDGEGATSPPATLEADARQLMERARAEGVNLVGPGGLLTWVVSSRTIPHRSFCGLTTSTASGSRRQCSARTASR